MSGVEHEAYLNRRRDAPLGGGMSDDLRELRGIARGPYVPNLWRRYQKANPDHVVVHGRNDLPVKIKRHRLRIGLVKKRERQRHRAEWRAVYKELLRRLALEEQ